MNLRNNFIYDSNGWWCTDQIGVNRSLICFHVKFMYFGCYLCFNFLEVLRLDFEKFCSVLKLIVFADVEPNARIILIRQKEYLLVELILEKFPTVIYYISVLLKRFCL